MYQRYLNFIHGVSVNWVGRLGVILTTSTFLTFLLLELARLAGIFTNQYMGLLTYLFLPALFVVGLVLIPIGWMMLKKQSGQTTRQLLEKRFYPDDVEATQHGSNVFVTILVLTLVNLLFLGLASMRTLKFMDTAEFCGTACHEVMNPEWVVYQDSPHARVKCVECHVGEGVDALIDSKLNGARQMFLATFDIYNQPIPTPVHTLRPARETCEKCHWPDKFYGNRLKTIVHYQKDEASTPVYTSLGLKVDVGKPNEKAGIHWHIAEENEVRYASVHDEREQMIWVEARQPDGSYKRFENQRVTQDDPESKHVRVLDCVDCHNRATHIYERPDVAIDEHIRLGEIDRTLPFVKRESLDALTSNYPSQEAGLEGIRNHMEGFYQRQFPQISTQKMAEIDQAIAALQAIYQRNIHHHMKITWGTYPSFIGHQGDTDGCFRCHNTDLVASDGTTISHGCTQCHSILANESDAPFKYLLPPEPGVRDSLQYEYLREEFMNWY